MKNSLIKIINCILVLMLLFFFKSQNTLLQILIVMGQAHFALAYYYQYKSGKINRRYGLNYLMFSIVLLSYFFFFLNETHLIIFTSALFVLHFLADEYHLNSRRLFRAEFYKIMPFLFAYTAFIFDGIPGLIYIKIMSLLSLAFYMFKLLRTKDSNSSNDTYLLVYAILLVLSTFGNFFNIKQNYMFFIVVVHYLNWYTYIFQKYQGTKAQINKYIADVLIFNGIFISLFIIYKLTTTGKFIFSVLFDPIPFYLWTLMHLMVTFRKSDIKALIFKPN
jgi:hypothetical protein